MSANSLVAIITKNRTNSAYVGARSGADQPLTERTIESRSTEVPDDSAPSPNSLPHLVDADP